MSYINKTITSSGTEIDFLWAFIQSVASADNRIVCNLTSRADVAALFESGTTPTFTFTVSSAFSIVFSRREGLSYINSYKVKFQYGQSYFEYTGDNYADYCFFSSNAFNSDVETQRTWKYQIISNDKAVFIRFGDYNAELPLTNTKNKGLIYSDTTNSIYFLANAVNGNYYVGSSGLQATKAARLPYLKNPDNLTQIEVIKSIVLIDASNILTANPDGLWDSSTNNAVGFPLTIGGEQCCYLDNNTVMKF